MSSNIKYDVYVGNAEVYSWTQLSKKHLNGATSGEIADWLIQTDLGCNAEWKRFDTLEEATAYADKHSKHLYTRASATYCGHAVTADYVVIQKVELDDDYETIVYGEYLDIRCSAWEASDE